MKHSSTLKEFAKYVSLNILGQVAFSCYTLADTFFVSAKLGTNGLTALNLAFPIFCILNGVGLLIGMGAGNHYAIAQSRNEKEKADKYFTNALYLVVIFALLFVVLGLFCSKAIVRFLGADETVIDITDTYAKVMLLFAPAFLTNNLLQCFVRNDGKPSLSMAAMIVGSFSNVLLDYVFIFPLDMGIFGAVLATGLAPLISICVLSPYLILKKNKFHFVLSKSSFQTTRNIFSSGFSPFLTEATSGVVMFLFNFIILGISGNVGVAAFGVITVVSLVVTAIYTGLSQGLQPLISRYHGAKEKETVSALAKYGIVTSLLLSILIYSVIFFCASSIVAIFNTEQDALLASYASQGMQIYFIAVPFVGANIVLATYFLSTEKPLFAQIISLLRGFFALIPLAFLFSFLFKMMGIWITYPITEAIVLFVGILLFWSVKKKEKAMQGSPKENENESIKS